MREKLGKWGIVGAVCLAGLFAQDCASVPFRIGEPSQCKKVAAGFAPDLIRQPCPAGTPESAECGTLTVGENAFSQALSADGKQSCRTDIAWLTVTPESATDDVPLFVLGGGPGDSVLSDIKRVLDMIEPVAKGRMLVFHDPRGVGESAPALTCRDVPPVEGANRVEWLEACSIEYRRRGHDSRAYTTAAFSDDIVNLASALEIERFDVIGVSYGSRLAQDLALTHPDRVQTLILDAATPTDAPLLEHLAGNLMAALDRMFLDCEQVERCNSRFGDGRRQFREILERLETGSEFIAIAGQRIPFSPALYLNSLSMLISQTALQPAVMAYISEVYERNYESTAYLLQNRRSSETAFFMHYAVMCSEELPRNDRDRSVADLAAFPYFSPTLPYDGLLEVCLAMGLKSTNTSSTVSTIKVPTLVLTGRYDPLSPKSNWDGLSHRFSNGTFVDIMAGHGTVRSTCGQMTIAAFLRNPTGLVLPECASQSPSLDFADTSLEVLRVHLGSEITPKNK